MQQQMYHEIETGDDRSLEHSLPFFPISPKHYSRIALILVGTVVMVGTIAFAVSHSTSRNSSPMMGSTKLRTVVMPTTLDVMLSAAMTLDPATQARLRAELQALDKRMDQDRIFANQVVTQTMQALVAADELAKTLDLDGVFDRVFRNTDISIELGIEDRLQGLGAFHRFIRTRLELGAEQQVTDTNVDKQFESQFLDVNGEPKSFFEVLVSFLSDPSGGASESSDSSLVDYDNLSEDSVEEGERYKDSSNDENEEVVMLEDEGSSPYWRIYSDE